MRHALTFRTANTDDINEISRLWNIAGLGGDDAYNSHEIAVRLREDDGLFIVGFDPDSPHVLRAVAMGCNDNHRGWVKRVAVDPALRGAGVGRALIDELEKRFVAAGIEQLRLSVYEDNETALAFWESMDFVELPEIRYFTKDLRQK